MLAPGVSISMRSLRITGWGAFLAMLAISLWAAEAWQTKPFGQWTDRDVTKVMNNSPWAHEVRITPSRPPAGGSNLSTRRRGGVDAASDSPMSADTGMRGSPEA